MNENNQIPEERSNIKTVALIALFSIVLFLNTLENNFTYDDLKIVQWNPFLVGDATPKGLLTEGRVVRTLTLMLDYKLFGMNPAGYHLQNILWHGLSTVLLYFLILRLSKDKTISVLSAIFFACHPIHVEAVANISNRKDILCLTFSLSAFLFYLKSYEHRGGKRRLTLFMAFVSIVLAMLSKQAAAVFPVMLFAYEFYFIPPGGERLFYDNRRWLWKLITPFVIYGAYYLFIVLHRFYGLEIAFKAEELILTTIRMLLFYNNMLLWPVNMSADHVFAVSSSIKDAKVLIAISMWLIMTWGVVRLYKKEPLISFGLLWYLVTLLPVLFIPGTGYFAAERYFYMPSVGFVLILAVSIERLLRHYYKATLVLLAAIMILFSLNTFNRNTIWENGETLWLDTLKKDPLSVRAVLNRALIYHYGGKPETAIPYYLKALEVLPDDPFTANNLAVAYEQLGRSDDVIGLYGKVLSSSTQRDLSNYKLIDALHELAFKEYQSKLQSDPNSIETEFHLGVLYLKMGEKYKALKAFERFVLKWKKDRRYTEIAFDEIKKLKAKL